METRDLIELILAGSGAVALLAGGFGFVVYSYKKSGRQERKDVTETADTISNFWKSQAEKLEEILKHKDIEFNNKLTSVTKEFNEKIQALTEKIGVLTGQLSAEKLLNERLEKIFQNRSPEMEAFMKYMVDATEKHSETHDAMLKVLSDLHSTSSANHEILDSRKKEVELKGTMETRSIN